MKMRTQWVLNHPLQMKFLFVVIVAMLFPMLVFGFCLYKLVLNLLARQMAFPEAINANIMPVIEKVNALLIIIVPFMTAVVLWLAVGISHRFVGPIERIEKDLDQILGGDKAHRIRIREKDDLKAIALKINTLLERLK